MKVVFWCDLRDRLINQAISGRVVFGVITGRREFDASESATSTLKKQKKTVKKRPAKRKKSVNSGKRRIEPSRIDRSLRRLNKPVASPRLSGRSPAATVFNPPQAVSPTATGFNRWCFAPSALTSLLNGLPMITQARHLGPRLNIACGRPLIANPRRSFEWSLRLVIRSLPSANLSLTVPMALEKRVLFTTTFRGRRVCQNA